MLPATRIRNAAAALCLPALCSVLCSALCLLASAASLRAQSAPTHEHEAETWVGYLSSVRVAERWALWHDYHLVPHTFFAGRVGLTALLTEAMESSGGYGFVLTGTPQTTALVRPEHRIWGQLVHRWWLHPRLMLQTRYRHDGRWRQNLTSEGALTDGYLFYHRMRVMASLRYMLHKDTQGNRYHLTLMNEYLHDVGRQVTNGMDQSRLYALAGTTRGNFTLLCGYDWRARPLRSGQWRHRHGFVVWLVHSVDIRRKKEQIYEPDHPIVQ